jgi:asparagine synthase (glutamine-hydrolysing)
MCGFAGILKRQGRLVRQEIEATLRAMGQQITYRGPDDEQLYCDDAIGLSFHRLSIVDVQQGQQPLFNEDRSLVLVVNGEIYNHQALKSQLKSAHHFRSQSDCEIILHLYEEMGIEFLKHLNGMFALLLWDKRAKILIAARDRLGIKPLYYTISKERILFASEIKALFAYPDCPRVFDWKQALSDRLDMPYSIGKLTSFFQGIEYLPGGSFLMADLAEDSISCQPYWQLTPLSEEAYAADQRTEEQIISGYRELLADAVKMRLMADVEVGLFLSGGIDSVSIAAFAAQELPLQTFSVLSQSTFQNGDARAGHLAARYFGLPNHQVLFSWHDIPFTPEAWKQLLWLCETPYCDAEQLYKYHLHRYAKSINNDLKVILLGQGSDEFNGGYSVGLTKAAHPDLDDSEIGWAAFMATLDNQQKELFISQGNGNLSQYARTLKKEFLASQMGQKSYRHPWFFHADRYLRSLQMYNLWHEDRTAAGNHIENRVPFLDHRLVEYTMRIPPQKYESLFWDKRILRQAMKNILPLEFAQRPKCPFFYGQDARYTHRMMYNLLMAEERALIREAFGDADGSHPVFDRKTIESFITEIPNDPEYQSVSDLLYLTNIGLLEQMAKASFTECRPPECTLVLSKMQIDDWDEEEEQIALRLSIRRQEIDLSQPVSFSPNTLLFKIDHVSPPNRDSYISVDNTITYALDEHELADWLAVLRRIDGKRSINDILNELSLPEAKIRKQLEEALDYQLISFHDRNERI